MKEKPQQTETFRALTILYRSRVDSPMGEILLTATDQGLCHASLPGTAADRADEEIARSHPGARIVEDEKRLAPYADALRQYFDGQPLNPDLPLDLSGTPFQIATWQKLRELGHGDQITYGQLAEDLGRPRAARAVGAACGRNPVPLFVPCHRVVARKGLGGFGGGLEMKRQLLRLEGIEA